MVQENRVFLGNPGTGKSTLINCLLGETHFSAGVSYGGGLTKAYQRYEQDGIAYMDTPGLADETILKQAAAAITQALKQDGKFKLFFMVRLQNGRVVSEDITTLERVLDSIEAGDLNYKYTVVMNSISPGQYHKLLERGDEFKAIKTLVNRRHLTESFCFVPRIDQLEERMTVAPLPQEFCDFINTKAPVISISASQVKPIDVEGITEQTQEIYKELERLREQQQELLQALRDQERRYEEAMSKHEVFAIPYDAMPESPRSGTETQENLMRQTVLKILMVMAMFIVITIVVVVIFVVRKDDDSYRARRLAASGAVPGTRRNLRVSSGVSAVTSVAAPLTALLTGMME